jgi:amino acid transporter
MSIVGFVILVLLVLIGIWVFVKLAALPGQKAAERGHPQAEAINILGWIGLLLGVAPWLVALVWAYTKPPVLQAASPATETADAANDNA